ncbi:hypothetical protein [Sphingomonas sanguinis]|uniref:Uncharacterized protein n=1 Tax=Sphingomonas sanguinis TaxID=33051 RepID=A0A147I598_9SPHN|nr:hypothetical protein [Sphingomonas sanguinis]KTT73818.1 hypothetical protein NS319_02620 [Sphingomonas sanguinis]
MTRREHLPLHDQAPVEPACEEGREGQPESMFLLIAGGIYGAIIGLCMRGEFALALLGIAIAVASACLGWWLRGER